MDQDITDRFTRVAVGMSGGLDSSAAAALLVDSGLDVTGLTLRMCRACYRSCGPDDIASARRIAALLDIEHRVVDAVDAFASAVLDPFVAAYLAGRTPSPCIVCNETIKFGFMLQRAREMGCEAVATGHYARIEQRDGGFALYRGQDRAKDQSYFLHRLTQAQLSRCVFPLANLAKRDEVTDLARRRGLPAIDRGESRDLCFVEQDRYAAFIEDRRGEPPPPGPIVDTSGNRIGEHDGIHRYTVGQRKGMGVAWSEPLYVIRIDPREHTIVAGTRAEATAPGCAVTGAHWIAEPSGGRFTCAVQIRYRHRPCGAAVTIGKDGGIGVAFDTPQFAPAPGQAAVFYDGDRVLGGGWIDRNTA